MTSTKISQSTKRAMKNKTGSAAFFQENFTVYSAPTLMESTEGVKKRCPWVVVHFQSTMTLKIEKDSSLCSE